MPRYVVPILHTLLAVLYAYHHNGISSQSTMRTIGALTTAAGTATILFTDLFLALNLQWFPRVDLPLMALYFAFLAAMQFLYTGLKCTSRSQNSTPL